MKFLPKILLLILIAWATILPAQTVDYDGLRFTAIPDLTSKNYFGYNFVRVLVTNSSNRERSVRLFLKVDYPRDIEEISKRFSIAPAEVREETLLFPVSDFSTPGVKVEVDGQLLPDMLAKYYRSYRNFYAKKQALVDAKISRTEFDAIFTDPGPCKDLDLEMNQFEGSSSQLYRNWLGYAQFNILIFYAATIEEMPEPVRRAVFDYVRTGGVLLTLGRVAVPEDFKKAASTGVESSLPSYEGGFGRVFTADASFFTSAKCIGIALFDLYADPAFKSESPLIFEDSEIETVSARWLMLVIYFFAFLIGPVNVFLLHRIGRKIWVFLTVPVASIICCSFIYGYYIVFESSTLQVKRQSVTLLNEKDNRAVTLANYSVFSARSREEGLHFDIDTEVFPITRDDYRSSDAGRFIVLDEDQHFKEGWIKPKVPRYLHLRAVQTRRERVALTAKDGRLELMNGLGADIEAIYLMTSAGEIWSGSMVTAGASCELKKVEAPEVIPATTPAKLFQKSWFKAIKDLKKYPMNFLQPGGYVARLKSSPFLRQNIDAIADLSEEAYIIGVLNEESHL